MSKFLVTAVCLFLSLKSFSQIAITGQVSDFTNHTVVNASISIVGQTPTGITDATGTFILTLPPQFKLGQLITLRVACDGYKTINKHIAISPISIPIKLFKNNRRYKVPLSPDRSQSTTTSQQVNKSVNTQNQPVNVTSYNQSGGLTAYQVNVNVDQSNKIISSLEFRLHIDEITSVSPITEKETSFGIQNAFALFDKNHLRYRFVTDYQFSIQQIKSDIRRVSFVYKPEDPSQISGQNFDLLTRMSIFGFNFSQLPPEIFGNPDNKKTHLITLEVYLNGVPIIILENYKLSDGLIYQGDQYVPVDQQFSNLEKAYNKYLTDQIKR